MPKTAPSKQKHKNQKSELKEEATKETWARPSKKKSARAKVRPIKRADSGARVLQVPKREWYKPLTWRYRQPVPNYKPLSKARIIFWNSLKQLWSNKKLFGGIVVIYGILNIVLVKGVSGSSNLQKLKDSLEVAVHGIGGKLVTSGVSFGYLLVSSGSNSSATSGIYQAILLVICSLAFIWTLRKVLAKQKARIRDGFYFGMYPIIPFVLLIMLIGVQLIPLIVGGGLYNLAMTGGIVTAAWQKSIFIAIFILFALWSLRMVTASIFALYIVTLPDMTPMRAYRSARQLVYGRRLLIWRKLIFLPIALLLLAALIELPLILYVTPLATWVFFVISMVTLPVVHSYLYNLYREML